MVDCVKVPGLAVRGSLGTLSATILMWDSGVTARRPPSHSKTDVACARLAPDFPAHPDFRFFRFFFFFGFVSSC